MKEEMLNELREDNGNRRRIKDAATAGPWHAVGHNGTEWVDLNLENAPDAEIAQVHRNLMDEPSFKARYAAAFKSWEEGKTEDLFGPDQYQCIAHKRWVCAAYSDVSMMAYGEQDVGIRGTDALFIAAAKNDPVEDHVDMLLNEVQRLRTALQALLDDDTTCEMAAIDGDCPIRSRIEAVLKGDVCAASGQIQDGV